MLFKVLLMRLARQSFVRILLTGILTVSIASSADSVLFIDPPNSTVIVSDSVGFRCIGTNVTRLDWQFIRNASLSDSQYASDYLCVTGIHLFSCDELVFFGELRSNYRDRYKFVTNTTSSGTKGSYLFIPKADKKHAGVYRCHGGFGKTSYSILNVIDPMPSCNEASYNNEIMETHINCTFDYYGVAANLHAEWNIAADNRINNCSIEYNRIACVFRIKNLSEDSCYLPQYIDKNQRSEFVYRNMSLICIWAAYQETSNETDEFCYTFRLGSRSVAVFRCFKNICAEITTPVSGTSNTEGTKTTIIALAVICFVIVIVILTVSVIKNGAHVKSTPGMATAADISTVEIAESIYSAAKEFNDEGSAPVYGKVVKSGSRKEGRNGSANGARIRGNTPYEDVIPTQDVPKRSTETLKTSAQSSNHDYDGNNVVYAELGCAPPTFRIVENRSPTARDNRFDRSEYAAIDHEFKLLQPYNDRHK